MNIGDLRKLDYILERRENEKNGGLPSGHPILRGMERNAKKHQEETQNVSDDDMKELVAKFEKVLKEVKNLGQSCQNVQSKMKNKRFANDLEERKFYRCMSRATQFLKSVENGMLQQIKLLK